MRRFGKLLWKHLKIQFAFSPILMSIISLIWLPKLLGIEFEVNPTVLEKSIVFFLIILIMWSITAFISVILCTIIDLIME